MQLTLRTLKNLNEIAKAKSEIIENITPGGTIILNRDDKFFNQISKKAKAFKLKICTFGKHKGSHIRLEKVSKEKKIKELL